MEETGLVQFSEAEAEIAKKRDLYMQLTVEGPNDEMGFQAVDTARKVIKSDRVAVQHREKELKAEANVWRKKVGDRAKELYSLISPIEEHLKAQCKIVTDEKERIAAEEARLHKEVIDNRMALLAGYDSHYPYNVIESMENVDFELHLEKVKVEWEVEQKRQAAEDAARKAEDERLAVIRAAQEKQMDEIMAQAEKNAAQEAEIAAEKAKLQATRDREEREKMVKEAEERAKVQAIADEKARVEREKKESEEKAAAEKAEKERVAALLPDKEKAIAWVESMRESIPKRPAIKDYNIALFVVIALDKIGTILNELHRDIEEA